VQSATETACILVVNDDGVDSPGIIALADGLRPLGDVTVVAPDEDRTGVGHSISVRHPVKVARVEGRSVTTYSCSGTPADCVIVGARDLCAGRPDIVVSGINRGANLADDVNYSGTVAAALEALLLGIPSMAVSLAASWPKVAPTHEWEGAARFARELVEMLLRTPLPADTLLNVNVPNLAYERVRGVRFTRQGRKRYRDRLARENADGARADGASYYWVWGGYDADEDDPETDMHAVKSGYVAASPLRLDRTDYAALEVLRGRALSLTPDA
jgi:5'-nucleotidase